jgi:hypothetical protein
MYKAGKIGWHFASGWSLTTFDGKAIVFPAYADESHKEQNSDAQFHDVHGQ